jgi:hypothetical protein
MDQYLNIFLSSINFENSTFTHTMNVLNKLYNYILESIVFFSSIALFLPTIPKRNVNEIIIFN